LPESDIRSERVLKFAWESPTERAHPSIIIELNRSNPILNSIASELELV
jgi:hypothetical protein